MWVRVLFARFITAICFSLYTYLQNYMRLDTVQSKYLNLDVFVVVFYSFVIVTFSDYFRSFYRAHHLFVVNMETG